MRRTAHTDMSRAVQMFKWFTLLLSFVVLFLLLSGQLLTLSGLSLQAWNEMFSFLPLRPSFLAIFTANNKTSQEPCPDVLHRMLKGRWLQREMTREEQMKLKAFHARVQVEHQMPKGVQRPDKLCGNLSVSAKLVWIRALCDPDGNTPCCYNNKCQNKTMKECSCNSCFDLRQPLHAEYSSWRPDDRLCQPKNWSVDEICRLLKNSTLYFIGDSFVRHVYTALLLAVTGNEISGAFAKNTPKDIRQKCSGIYMFSEKVCRLWLDTAVHACNGTVTLQLHYLYVGGHEKSIHSAVMKLQNQSRSFVFIGFGFHDQFNLKQVKDRVMEPLLKKMKSQKLEWPKLLWASIHQFGLMRSGTTHVHNKLVKEFNHNMRQFLGSWKVPVFDTFNFTTNMASFDGQHYGLGVNRMKVNILLHYLEELQAHGQW